MQTTEKDWKEAAKEDLSSTDPKTVASGLNRLSPVKISRVLNENPEIELKKIYEHIQPNKAVKVFEGLVYERQMELLQSLPAERARFLLNEASPDDRTSLLQNLSEGQRSGLMKLLSPKERNLADSLLQYPKESIGRLMTPNLISVKPDWSIEQTLAHIRKHGVNSETLNVIYVIDDHNHLIDDLKIKEILLAPLDSSIREIMDNDFIALHAHDDQEASIKIFKEANRDALPVTDFNGLLVGLVTSDDLLDVIEQEDTEDIHKLGGSETLRKPYFKTSVAQMIKKRAGWLILLFFGQMFTVTAMSAFEEQIAQAVLLALFVPLIIASGGNTGSQAATIITRALALGQITLRDWWEVMKREFQSGLVLGAILGTLGFLRIALWVLFFDSYGEHWLSVAFTITVALVGVVLWGTLIGSLFPIILDKLGFDPATSSAPFVATVVDITGLLIYFGIAILFLQNTLLA